MRKEKYWEKLPGEEWKIIDGFNGMYEVSNYGRVLSHYYRDGGRIMKPYINKLGYEELTLQLGNHKQHTEKVHKLVAMAFIENPKNYKQVNHKDENKSNNRVDNLEWCDAKYNSNYGTKTKRTVEKLSKPIVMKDLSGKVIRVFKSATEASKKLKIDRRGIANVCEKRRKTYKGYIWEFI